MKNKIIKGATIALFVCLITAFVAYRSGYIGAEKSTNLFGSTDSASNEQTDTILHQDYVTKPEMMSSSKYFVLSDNRRQNPDTNKVTIDSTLEIDPMLYSSKSAIILNQDDMKLIWQDSNAIDSLNK